MSNVTNFNEHRLKSLQSKAETVQELKTGGGSGTSDGMDLWPQSVETRLGQLHSDVRQVLYVTIACAVFLLGAGAFAYNRTDDNVRALDSRVRSVEAQTVEINGKLDVLLERTTPKH